MHANAWVKCGCVFKVLLGVCFVCRAVRDLGNSFFFLKMILELSAHGSGETAQRELATELNDPSFFPRAWLVEGKN